MRSAVLLALGGLLLVAWPAPAKAKERPEKLSFDIRQGNLVLPYRGPVALILRQRREAE